MNRHTTYRPDIDGLRAVAILPVVLFHAFPALMPGGFVGVDVFFVISGYLITGILLRGQAAGQFSLLDFYARRIRRIFPALIAMLAGVGIFGWLISLPDEYELLGKHIAAAAGFILNLSLFVDTNPYFGAITTPLVHLWSLGVEEQFYLFWPVFLWATVRLRKWQLALIALVTAASFSLNVATISSEPLQSFYLPSSRLWELSIGALLAYVQQNGNSRLEQIHVAITSRWPRLSGLIGNQAQAMLGAVLLLVCFATFNERMGFPGWWALVPTCGALLLISAGPQAWVNRNVLSRRGMVYIGLISYPLYLWHWPLLSFAHTMDWRQFAPWMQTEAVALSFVLAALTYKYIELPVRSSQRIRQLAVRLGATMAACALIGYLGFTQRIPARATPENVDRFVRAAAEDYPFPNEPGFLTHGSGAKQTLFIGDSTLAQYHSRVEKVLANNPLNARRAVFAWRPGCAPDISVTRVAHSRCKKLLEDAVEYAKNPQVDTVVIGFSWYSYFTGNRNPDHIGEARPLLPGAYKALDNVKRMAADFARQGKRVYILLSAPLDPGFAPLQMVRRTVLAPGFQLDIRSPARDDIAKNFDPFVSRLRQIARETGATVIDQMNALCDAHVCSAVTPGGEAIYRDQFHLRKAFVRENVHFLDETVLDVAVVAADR